jgi:hypothetical protein
MPNYLLLFAATSKSYSTNPKLFVQKDQAVVGQDSKWSVYSLLSRYRKVDSGEDGWSWRG